MILIKSGLGRGVVGLLLVSSCVAVSRAAEPDAAGPGGKEIARVAVQAFDKVEVQQFPWGWIRWLMNAEIDPQAEMTFGMVYIKPNQENPAHLHPKSTEILHVLEGSCEHLVGDQWVTLKKGDTVRIPKQVPHRARTTGEPCRAVIVYNTGKRQFVQVGEGEED
jgi:quercetin dioxygenase-like cupin family protein